MIRKILAELAFLREFAADNGLPGYFGYRLRRLRKTTDPITVRDRGQRFVLRPYGPDLNVIRIARPENFTLLEQNIAGNDRIEAVHAALTTDDAPEILKLQNRQTGAWGVSIAPTAEGQDMEEVRSLRISDLMKKIGSETPLLTPGAAWIARANVLMIELHERIMTGCEAAFFAANVGRCILVPGGEKFVSNGPGYLARQEEGL